VPDAQAKAVPADEQGWFGRQALGLLATKSGWHALRTLLNLRRHAVFIISVKPQ